MIGSLTAAMATLANVSWLLIVGSAAKVAFDLAICTCSLLVHYGVGLQQCSNDEARDKEERRAHIRRKIQRRRRKRRK